MSRESTTPDPVVVKAMRFADQLVQCDWSIEIETNTCTPTCKLSRQLPCPSVDEMRTIKVRNDDLRDVKTIRSERSIGLKEERLPSTVGLEGYLLKSLLERPSISKFAFPYHYHHYHHLDYRSFSTTNVSSASWQALQSFILKV